MSNMKILVMSDIHNEFSVMNFEETTEEVDVVLIAGDLGKPGDMAHVMLKAREAYDAPVLAVEGNHDWWRSGRKLRTPQKIRAHTDKLLAKMNETGPLMKVLRRGDAVVLGNTRFIGATLWTDGRLNGADNEYDVSVMARVMSDNKKITIHDENRGIWRKATPTDFFREHRADLNGISKTLETDWEGETVIMTHHAPLRELIEPVRNKEGDDVSPAYASDLSDFMSGINADIWVFGHTHQPQDVSLDFGRGPVRFVSNPRGYPSEKHAFDPRKVIDLGDDLENNLGMSF